MNIGIFSGHLTADATFTPGTDQSKNRAKFKLAVSDSYDKNLVSFYTCIAFGPKANYIGNGLQKGRFLKGCEARVEGRLNTKDFTDQNGVKHTYQELTINEVEASVHKNWSEGQDQQYVPNSGNNQDQQSYTGSVAPAGRSQGGPDEYSYGTPQGNGQNNQGQRSYAGSAAPAGRSQGNGQNQRFNEPQRSQNNQGQRSYNGSAVPAGRPQGGPDEYSYGTPQGNGQNNQGQRSYAGSAAPAGRSQGNGQNQRFNEPQRSQNNQGQRSYNGSAAPAGRSQGTPDYYDDYNAPQRNGQGQHFNDPQRGQGSPSRDFSRNGEPAPLPDALPPAPDFASGNGQGSNADGGGFHPAKFGSY